MQNQTTYGQISGNYLSMDGHCAKTNSTTTLRIKLHIISKKRNSLCSRLKNSVKMNKMSQKLTAWVYFKVTNHPLIEVT